MTGEQKFRWHGDGDLALGIMLHFLVVAWSGYVDGHVRGDRAEAELPAAVVHPDGATGGPGSSTGFTSVGLRLIGYGLAYLD